MDASSTKTRWALPVADGLAITFGNAGSQKRDVFRWRQLAAEMLLIELEGDFGRMSFPDIDLTALLDAIKKYEKTIPPSFPLQLNQSSLAEVQRRFE